MKIDFVKFSNSAIVPTKGTKAGFDPYCVKMLLYLQILWKLLGLASASKSLEDTLEKVMRGLAWQLDVPKLVGASSMPVIESLLRYFFFNYSEKSVDIGNTDRFCQVVFHKIANDPVLKELDNFEDKNDRGEGSFSSTNTKNGCRQDIRQ